MSKFCIKKMTILIVRKSSHICFEWIVRPIITAALIHEVFIFL